MQQGLDDVVSTQKSSAENIGERDESKVRFDEIQYD